MQQGGATPLINQAREGHLEAVAALVDAKADTQVQDTSQNLVRTKGWHSQSIFVVVWFVLFSERNLLGSKTRT
jgi:hypothetical protein